MTEIDKREHYGRYQDQEDRRNKLGMKMAYKALDIPEADMDIHANKTVNGIGALGAVGIALAATAIPSALAAWLALRQPDQPQVAPSPPKTINNNSGFLIDFAPPEKK